MQKTESFIMANIIRQSHSFLHLKSYIGDYRAVAQTFKLVHSSEYVNTPFSSGILFFSGTFFQFTHCQTHCEKIIILNQTQGTTPMPALCKVSISMVSHLTLLSELECPQD